MTTMFRNFRRSEGTAAERKATAITALKRRFFSSLRRPGTVLNRQAAARGTRPAADSAWRRRRLDGRDAREA